MSKSIMRFSLMALACLAIAIGCEKEESSSSPPATTQAASATTRPSTRSALLATAATLPNIPATTQTTEPFDPMKQPDTAVEYMYQQIKAGRFDMVRQMAADPISMQELRDNFSSTRDQLRAGGKIEIVEVKPFNQVAMVICHYVDTNPDHEAYYAMTLMQRYDRWRVLLTDVNTRRLTEGEVTNLRAGVAWAKQRVLELRDAAAKARAATSAPTTR